MSIPHKEQIAFRYRTEDSATGLTRETVKQMASLLGMDETQTIHHALRQLANELLPRYEPDEGPLSNEQIALINGMHKVSTAALIRTTLLGDTP